MRLERCKGRKSSVASWDEELRNFDDVLHAVPRGIWNRFLMLASLAIVLLLILISCSLVWRRWMEGKDWDGWFAFERLVGAWKPRRKSFYLFSNDAGLFNCSNFVSRLPNHFLDCTVWKQTTESTFLDLFDEFFRCPAAWILMTDEPTFVKERKRRWVCSFLLSFHGLRRSLMCRSTCRSSWRDCFVWSDVLHVGQESFWNKRKRDKELRMVEKSDVFC